MVVNRLCIIALLLGHFGFIRLAVADELPLGAVVFDKVSASVQGAGLLDIEGHLGKEYSGSALDINGYQASLEQNGRFSLALPPSAIYQLSLYAADGTYQTVEYVAPGSDVKRAVQVVVGADFLDELKLPLSRLVSNLDLADVLKLNDGHCAVDTAFLMGCDLYVDQLQLRSEPVIHELFASPSAGERLTLNLKASIPSADLTGRLQRPVLFFWQYRKTTFNLQRVDLDLKVDVVPGPDGSVRLETDGAALKVKIGGLKVIETNNLVSYLVPVFKDAIALLLNQRIALTVAGPYLEDIPIAARPATIALDLDGDQVDDIAFTADIGVQGLDVLGNGDPYALLGGSISPATPLPGRAVLGYRRHGGEPPQPEPVAAPTDVRAGLSVDLLNQVLMAVYQSGVDETFQVTDKVEEFGRLTSQFIGLGIDPGSDISVKVGFGGVPESVTLPGGVYPLGLQVFLPQMTLAVKGVSKGKEMLLISLTGDFVLNSSLGVQPDGSLQLEFGDNVIKGDITAIQGGKLYDAIGGSTIDPDVLRSILNALLPFLLNEIQPVISGVINAIPLGLDAGKLLGALLAQHVPSLQVTAEPTEADMSADGAYLNVGVGINIQE